MSAVRTAGLRLGAVTTPGSQVPGRCRPGTGAPAATGGVDAAPAAPDQDGTVNGGGTSPVGGVEVGSPEIRRALLFSFWDGVSAQAMVALNETFAVAAGLRLHASPLAISLPAALPLLFGALLQYFLPVLLNRGWNRKAMVLSGVRLQSAFLFLAAAAGWLPAPTES